MAMGVGVFSGNFRKGVGLQSEANRSRVCVMIAKRGGEAPNPVPRSPRPSLFQQATRLFLLAPPRCGEGQDGLHPLIDGQWRQRR